jgi:hypothetical protein
MNPSEELKQFVVEIADGVIGAANVLMQMFQLGASPAHFSVLKEFDLKGSRLWVLYKDVCLNETPILIAFLDACHAGGVGKEQVDHYINELMASRNDELAKEMREKLVHPAVTKTISDHLETGGSVG